MRHSPLFWAMIVALTVAHWKYVQYVMAFIIVFYVIRMLVRMYRLFRRIATNYRLKDVDTMNGLEFERYVADILLRQGYSNVMLTEQYDYGVDIIATKDGVR